MSDASTPGAPCAPCAPTTALRAPLTPIAGLGGAEARSDLIGAARIAEVPDIAFASVSRRLGQDAAFADAARATFAAPMPDPGRWHAAGGWRAMWTGPGQWLVDAPFARGDDIAGRLKAGFGAAASITEQTDAWATFALSGEDAIAVLERLCPVDLHAMAAGHAARTSIEHVGCHLVCRAPGRDYDLIAVRSFALALRHALIAAAESVARPVTVSDPVTPRAADDCP